MERKINIFFAHSAGTQAGKGEGSFDLVFYLRKALGEDYKVLYPVVNEPNSPTYDNWKVLLDEQLNKLDETVILVGHSLGGSMLLKYLSEEKTDMRINGMFLVATPQWSKDGWDVGEFAVQEDFSKHLPQVEVLYFYHCVNDPIVPFGHLDFYRKAFNNAIFRELSCKDHAFSNGLNELSADIRRIAENHYPL